MSRQWRTGLWSWRAGRAGGMKESDLTRACGCVRVAHAPARPLESLRTLHCTVHTVHCTLQLSVRGRVNVCLKLRTSRSRWLFTRIVYFACNTCPHCAPTGVPTYRYSSGPCRCSRRIAALPALPLSADSRRPMQRTRREEGPRSAPAGRQGRRLRGGV